MRGHKLKVREETFKTDPRGNFSHRRNELPEDLAGADTIITLKRHLDRYLLRKGMEQYWPTAGDYISIDRHHSRYGEVGLNAPVLCCTTI